MDRYSFFYEQNLADQRNKLYSSIDTSGDAVSYTHLDVYKRQTFTFTHRHIFLKYLEGANCYGPILSNYMTNQCTLTFVNTKPVNDIVISYLISRFVWRLIDPLSDL